MRRRPLARAAVLAGLVAAAAPLSVLAQSEPDDGPGDSVPQPVPLSEAEPTGDEVEVEPGTLLAGDEAGRVSVLPIPPGCTPPELPHVVFVGTVVATDFRTARFEIESVRDGELSPFAGQGLIDVRYGLDIDVIDEGERYLVSAQVEPTLGLLVSKVREPAPMFGGDDIVGLAESDVDCPVLEDPIRTLRVDGTAPDSSIITPFVEDRRQLLGTVAIPLGVAFGIVFALALLKYGLTGLWRGLTAAFRYRPPSMR